MLIHLLLILTFFMLAAARRADYIDNRSLTEVVSFTAFITNDFEPFLITFQSMTPRIHLLYTEMSRLIRTLMSKFAQSRLLVNEIDVKNSPNQLLIFCLST